MAEDDPVVEPETDPETETDPDPVVDPETDPETETDPEPVAQEYTESNVYEPDPILTAYLISLVRYAGDRNALMADGVLDSSIICSALFTAESELASIVFRVMNLTGSASLIYDHERQVMIFSVPQGNYRVVAAEQDKVRRTYFEMEYLVNRFVRERNIVAESVWPKIVNAKLEAQFISA